VNNSLDLAEFLMEHAHAAVVPGGAFGEDRCIRFSYALSMEDLEKGFNGIARALRMLS
jgi:aspartate aminotransferase